MKNRKWLFGLCLFGSAVLLFLGLTLHWLFWIAMAALIPAAFLLKK